MTWETARQTCIDSEAELASVSSSEENSVIFQMGGGQEVWLGGRYSHMQGTGSWSDGTPWDDHQASGLWQPGQPSPNVNHNCIIQGQGENWLSVSCNREHSFVCEISKGKK